MKKLISVLVFLFAVMAGVNAQTGRQSASSDPRFISTYNQALLLNEDRFADLDKIQIGDTVYFPARTGLGVEYWIADYPNYGVHDCIWNLTGKYLANQLPTVVDTTEIARIPILIPPVLEESTNGHFWIWFVCIGLAILAIVAFIKSFFPWNKRRNLDHNPAISGGLSNNPVEAASQISALIGSRVVKSERGRLICAAPTKVDMNFSDGLKRVQLVSGEEYYRITESNGNVRYARLSCGNLIGGSFSLLPLGVTFVPNAEPGSSWTDTPNVGTQEKSLNADADTANQEGSPIEVSLHSAEESSESEIVEFLRVAGEMSNKPLKIIYKDLTVEFAQIEKAEDK